MSVSEDRAKMVALSKVMVLSENTWDNSNGEVWGLGRRMTAFL